MEFGRTRIFLIILCFRSIRCEDMNKKVGTSAVLKPTKTSGPIKNILWRKGGNIAMEYNSPDPVVSYREFEVRGFLDTKTGEMNITGLTYDDSGPYSVEINNLVNKQIRLNVLASVGKPNISASCGPDHCNLTCVGDTEKAGEVSYIWIIDNEQKPNKTKEYTITRDDKIVSIQCELENAVSSLQSDPIPNPLPPPVDPEPSPGKTAGVVFGVILLLLLLIGLILFILHKKGIVKFPRNRIFSPGQPETPDNRGQYVSVGSDQQSSSNQGQNGADVCRLDMKRLEPNSTAAGNDDVITNGPQAEGVEQPGPPADPTKNLDEDGEAPTSSDNHGNADASKPTDKPDDGEPAPDKKPQEN